MLAFERLSASTAWRWDLKEVPKRLHDVSHDVQTLRSFVADIQRELSQSNEPARQVSQSQLQRLSKTLKSTALCATELTGVLVSVMSSAGSSRTQRAWRAVVSLSKQKEVLLECDRLERLKQELQLELQALGVAGIHSVRCVHFFMMTNEGDVHLQACT